MTHSIPFLLSSYAEFTIWRSSTIYGQYVTLPIHDNLPARPVKWSTSGRVWRTSFSRGYRACGALHGGSAHSVLNIEGPGALLANTTTPSDRRHLPCYGSAPEVAPF